MVASSEEIGIGLLLLIGYGWRRESKRFISAATKGAALTGGPRRLDAWYERTGNPHTKG
jgi:hypothetical protein